MERFWTIQTDDGLAVEYISSRCMNEDDEHNEDDDTPMVFEGVRFTVWARDHDEPELYKSKEDAEKGYNLLPESIRSAFHIMEWGASSA